MSTQATPTQIKDALADFYLEWRNNWLTHEAYAEHYDIDLTTCTKMINQGRKWQDERAERLQREAAKEAQPKLEVKADWQTQSRGTMSDEYDIYCACAAPDPALGRLKTFDEWMGS